MNNFSLLLNEMADEQEVSIKSVEKIVMDAWNKIMPKSKIVLFKGGLSSSYMIFTCTLGNDKSEYPNGYRENDALHLSFSIDISKTPLTIEYKSSSLSINPINNYYAFSTKKLKLRKTKTKSLSDMKVKLEKAFNKVKDEIKKSLTDGEFTVHSIETQKMIKSKV